MIRFELLKNEHIDEIIEIENRCFPGDAWTRNMFESELNNIISVFVVGIDEDDNSVVCYGGVWLIADIGEVTNIAVAPELWRQGIGGKLLSLLIDICTEHKMSEIDLEVKATNTSAVSLYKKMGFQVVGQRREYYKDKSDALLMTKKL